MDFKANRIIHIVSESIRRADLPRIASATGGLVVADSVESP